jgi:hypothetical protein
MTLSKKIDRSIDRFNHSSEERFGRARTFNQSFWIRERLINRLGKEQERLINRLGKEQERLIDRFG